MNPRHYYGRSMAELDRIEIPKVPANVRLSIHTNISRHCVDYHFECPVPGDDVVHIRIACDRYLASERGHVQAMADSALREMSEAIGRRVMGGRR